jgi:hypothetical protein
MGWKAYTEKLCQLSQGEFIRYEKLWAVPWAVVKSILQGLGHRGLTIEDETIRYAIRSTKNIRHDPSTLPVESDMGVPRKWKAGLEVGTVQAIEEYCGELMDVLGYRKE